MLPELHNLNLGPAVRRIARYVSILFLLVMMASPEFALGQRRVDFPPAESEPPPRHRSPPRTQAGGEDTGLISDFGAIMRKTQERTPPPADKSYRHVQTPIWRGARVHSSGWPPADFRAVAELS